MLAPPLLGDENSLRQLCVSAPRVDVRVCGLTGLGTAWASQGSGLRGPKVPSWDMREGFLKWVYESKREHQLPGLQESAL